MNPTLLLPLAEVRENGESAVDVSVPPEEFPGAVDAGELVGPVAVKGKLEAQDDEAVFAGEARGRSRFECARCLTPVEVPYAAPVEQRGPLDVPEMDVSDEVRQAVVLAQPMKAYCRPDCKGICVVCGKNRNLDDCGHLQEEPREPRRPRLTPRPNKG